MTAPFRASSALLFAAVTACKALGAGIAGQVTSDGKPLANAWVQLNTGLLAVTDARGRYSFSQLPQATYALQVFAPTKEPVIITGLVPGKGRADCALAASSTPRGLIHVKATAADGSLRPVRIVTRWRAAEGAAWAIPAELQYACTLDGQGRPFVPAEASRPCIVPFGACLWTGGEAVLALPPGQAEITCTSGVLMRATQQTVEVKPNEVVEVAVPMTLASELGAVGWTSGALNLRLSNPDSPGQYLVNVPLAATICRGEGFDWAVLAMPYGNDPAQTNARQVITELRTDRFGLWAAPQLIPDSWGAHVTAIGVEPPALPHAPNSYLARLFRRGVFLYIDPFASPTARELAFDVVADPEVNPVLHVAPAGPGWDRSLEVLGMLISQGRRVGCVAFAKGALDSGHLPIPERTLVQTNGKIDLAEIAAGLQRRATLVTTGPVLSLAVGEAGPGQSLPADDRTQIVHIDAILGCVPGGGIARLELLRGGRVARAWDVPEASPNHLQARIAIRENEPTWFALRALGFDAAQAACTSPIFFADSQATGALPLQARISGEVTDAVTGAPLAGARITATLPGQRAITATTGADGRYVLEAPVTAMLEVSHPTYPKIEATSSSPQDRANATVKFVVWDSEEVRAALDSGPSDGLLSSEFLEHLKRLLAAPTVNFRLRGR